MKEITREDWLKNPTPRMMWVWDNNETDKVKRLVVHCLKNERISYPFVAESEMGGTIEYFKYCAEITEEEPRRMTNQEVAWWVRDCPEEHREWKYNDSNTIHCEYIYLDGCSDKLCPNTILIRSNGGEWHEPLVEVEE